MDSRAGAGSHRPPGGESRTAIFDIDEVIGQVSDAFERTAQQKGLEFVLHRSRDVPARLVGDALRLGHILTHLTANAVKYTSRGEVSVTVERESVDDRSKEVVLRISVNDTGIGLDDKFVALFQPFRRDATPAPGTAGRGLVVIREAVRALGGAMEIATASGIGSDFSFTARFGIAAPDDAAAPRFDGLRVLVVDDNDTARLALQHLLESAGCRVTAASDGAAAIEAVTAAPIRMAIVDSSMPGGDALETMHRLCSGAGRPSVIATVTHFSREKIMAHAGRQQVPVAAYLLKPVKADSLYRLLADVAGTPRDDAAKAPMAALLDARGAQDRLGGSPELLERMLCNFRDAEAGAAEEVRALIEGGRLEEASRRVHMAKGTAMILGLERFTAVAASLEKVLRRGDRVSDMSLLSAFADELAAAIEACATAHSARPGAAAYGRAPDAATAAAVQAVLQRLAPLLGRNSMAAMAAAQELDALLPGAAAGIKASLHKFDFATAHQELERLAADLAVGRA